MLTSPAPSYGQIVGQKRIVSSECNLLGEGHFKKQPKAANGSTEAEELRSTWTTAQGGGLMWIFQRDWRQEGHPAVKKLLLRKNLNLKSHSAEQTISVTHSSHQPQNCGTSYQTT